MKSRTIVIALAICLGAGFGRATWAQAVTATLLGTVSDSTGAVLPGVSVTVTNVGTALQQSLVTDAEGRYHATQLPPGAYRVTAELQGFKRDVRRITLEVN